MQELRRSLEQLQHTLQQLAARDSGQELTGVALRVSDSVLGSARAFVPVNHPVAAQLDAVVSVDAISESDGPPRVVDVLSLVDQVLSALPRRPRVGLPRPSWVRKRV